MRGRKQRPLNIQGRRSTLRLDTSLWKGPCAPGSQHKEGPRRAGLVADGAHDDEGHAVEIGGLRDGAALHLAAQVAEGREDALLLFRGRDDSVGKVLSKGVVRRRKTSMTDYRLEQVADYLCTIELALVKYEAKENGETYNKFFGGIGSFKRNWLKQARNKRI